MFAVAAQDLGKDEIDSETVAAVSFLIVSSCHVVSSFINARRSYIRAASFGGLSYAALYTKL